MSAGAGTADGRVPALLEMIGASWVSQALCVAAELGIADRLAGGPSDIADLARVLNCEQATLYRFLRALAGLGLCAETEDGRFALTPLAEPLRADAADSLRAWALWWGRYQWQAWGHLADSVRTGESARHLLTGWSGYELHAADPEAAAVFDRAMVELTRLVAAEVREAYDFSAVRRLVDVGGGYGELLCAILPNYPAMRAVLFDLPRVVEGAANNLAAAGVADRCELVCGDFFESVPEGADLYVLKSVLHNWEDGACLRLLGNCRVAMSTESGLLLIERVMPSRMTATPAARIAARNDLNMMVGPGGRERTQGEFESLLRASGLRATRFTPTPMGFCLIEVRSA